MGGGSLKRLRTKDKNVLSLIENNQIFLAIRNGMILAIPLITVGSIALLLMSIPIPAYQNLLESFLGGAVRDFFRIIQNSTLGVISLILLLTISFSYEQLADSNGRGVAPLVSLGAYLAYTSDVKQGINVQVFQSIWLFNAIVVAIISSVLFCKLCKWMPIRPRYTNGADSTFNVVLSGLPSACITICLFVLLNIVMVKLFGQPNFQKIVSEQITQLFNDMDRNLWSGFLFVFLLHFMWFFGIHGGNVLDDVVKGVFGSGAQTNLHLIQSGQVPTEILSKSFFDTFVLFGGCGTILCLIIAIFIWDRRKSVSGLTKMAALPALFNINELIVFGLPVVLNPVFFLPFILTPLVLTAVSYLATVMGLVPYVLHSVEWTTPIFLSGYAATGSVAGSILQFVNLVIGILIYMPFVKLSRNRFFKNRKEQLDGLTDYIKECEKTGSKPDLLSKRCRYNSIAKILIGDLRHAMKSHQLELYYQPQMGNDGRIVGAEALLRWKHRIVGFIYPPLVIALAEEGGFLDEVELQIAEAACSSLSRLNEQFSVPFCLSFNITARQLDTPGMIDCVRRLVGQYRFGRGQLGVELTEQTALSSSPLMMERLVFLQEMGVQVIMDDFGMGHSSMMYLQNNQFDVVKLDGSLIQQIGNNKRCGDIISSILYLSRSLDFHVLAEYVETQEQKKLLENLGCSYYQGYLYSPALPFDDLVSYIQEHGGISNQKMCMHGSAEKSENLGL